MSFDEYYNNLNPEIKEYFKILSPVFPSFLIPFIETKTMMRLKDIGYFCGMDYGNKKVYDFKFYLSTLDHSISSALMVWGRTFNQYQTLAALFHDAGSPALRHVIDYLNNDHIKQESTEIELKEVIEEDKQMLKLINLHKYNIDKMIDYKNYPLVDRERPMLCADRLDGIFLSSLVWAKNITLQEIKEIYDNIIIIKNEYNQDEFSFIDVIEADKLVELNDIINDLTHSEEDYFSMSTLAEIVKLLIKERLIKYDDLFILTDKDIFNIINNNLDNKEINKLYDIFINIDDNHNIIRLPIKKRIIDPLILKLRYSKY